MFATLLTLAMGAGAFDVASADSSIEQAVKDNLSSGNSKSSATNNIHLDRDVMPVRTSSLVVNNGSSLTISDSIEKASFAPQGAMVGNNDNQTIRHSEFISESTNSIVSVKNSKILNQVQHDRIFDNDEIRHSEDGSPNNSLTVQSEGVPSLSLRTTDNNKNLNNLANKSDKISRGGITLTAGASTLTPAQIGAVITDTAAPMESGALHKSLLDAQVWSTATTFSLTQEEKEELVSIKDLVNAYASVPLDIVSVANNGEIGINSAEVIDNGEISLNVYGDVVPLQSSQKEEFIIAKANDSDFVWDLRNEEDDEPAEVDHLRARVDSVLGGKTNALMAKIKGMPTGFASGSRVVVNSGETVSTVSQTFSGNTITNVSGGFIDNSGTIGQVIAQVTSNTINTSILPSLITNSGTITSITGTYANNIANYTADNNSDDSVVIKNAGTIDTINASFINNKMNAASYGSSPQGTIYNIGRINHIYGSYIGNGIVAGNTTNGTWGAFGGVIATNSANNNTHTGDINATFIGNYAINNTASRPAGGGAIHFGARGTNYKETVDSINGAFINNYVQTTSETAQGGAIDVYTNTTIGSIGIPGNYAEFINNYAQSTSGSAFGGAIHNAGTISGDINANFINNYAQSTSGSAQGGAIYNAGTINGTLKGDFINNKLVSTTGSALGGAIYNSGTIKNVVGRFIGNTAQSTDTSSGKSYGGAIFNGGNMTVTNSYFKDNKALESYTADYGELGGAIYNNSIGKMIIKNSDFINNSSSDLGGAIFNESGNIFITDSNFIGNTTIKSHSSFLLNSGGNAVIKNSTVKNSVNSNSIGATWVYAGSTSTFIDTNFLNNSNGSITIAGDNAIANIVSAIRDVTFFNNGTDLRISPSGSNKAFNLNAASGKQMRFGGVIDAVNGIINLNKSDITYTTLNDDYTTSTATITQKGGKYVFGNSVSASSFNIFNGTNVQFVQTRQADGTATVGTLNASATTNDANGGYLNFANGSDQTQALGNLTLGSDLKVGIDSGEKLSAGTVTANSHKILVDYINATAAGAYTLTETSALKSTIDLSSTLKINSAYEWNGYSASYDSSTGNLTLTKVDTGTENLVGFLHNDDGSDTYAGKRGSNVTLNSIQGLSGNQILNQVQNDVLTYTLTRDEQALVGIGTMAGTSKTIEGNGYTIMGNQNAGIELQEGQVLTINNANIEGFYKENHGSVVNAGNGTLNINNSTFRNNTTLNGAGGAINGKGEIVDSSFYNNGIVRTGGYPSGGALAGNFNVYARTKDSIFDGNYDYDGGGAYRVNGTAEIKGENGHRVIFSNNSSYGGGTVMAHPNAYVTIENADFKYNSSPHNGGALYLYNETSFIDVLHSTFKGNSAGVNGGVVYNNGGTLSITDSIFDSNIATEKGGAICNTGTISEISDTTFTNNTAAQGGAIYNAGTITKMDGVKFVDNSLVDVAGGFIYNAGTIGSIDAEVKGNIVSNSSMVSALINNYGGNITSIKGEISDNIVNVNDSGGGSDNGIVLYNVSGGTIDTIDAIISNNKMLGIGPNPLGTIYNTGRINHIYGTFSNNEVISEVADGTFGTAGAAIWQEGTIGEINATFTGNHVISMGSNYAAAGAIEVFNTNNTGSINGIFKNNYAQSTGAGNAYGGAIYSRAPIVNLSGIYDGNYVSTVSGSAQGGAINNTSTIGSIGSADAPAIFSGNYATSVSGDAYGGALYNAGTITEITDANFTGNYAESTGSDAHGGGIYNTGTITSINADFTDNYAQGNAARGGGIRNEGTIGNITGDFTGNYTYGTKVLGGASNINKNGATIDNITGNFTGNYAKSSGTGVAQGGAIYNSKTITNLYGDFSNNYATSTSEVAQGGAVYNYANGTINNITGSFIGNYAQATSGTAKGGAVYNYANGTINNITGSFIGNYTKSTSGSAQGGAIWNSGTMGIVANGSDTIFKGNKTISGSTTAYNDIYNSGTIHLNAASGNSISFGGTIEGSSGTININNGYNSSATGGDYIFYNTVSGNTMNLYDGANVKLRYTNQADGTTTHGAINLNGFTSTGANNILDTIDGATADNYSLGATTLNADTKLRINSNFSGTADNISATSFSGSGKFLIDRVDIWNSGTTYTARVADGVLKSHVAMASNYKVFQGYYKNNYNVTYDPSTGYLTFVDNGTRNYNLIGFLSQDASSTSYTLDSDEGGGGIGAMAGSNNTKTVNAGNYIISGLHDAGVTVDSGQTLNINGGIWDGFYKNTSYGGVFQNTYGTLNINNATFTNNYGLSHGGILFNDGNSTTTINNSTFINNTSGFGYGGALFNRENAGTTYHGTMTVNNSTFTGNTIAGAGGAIGTASAIVTTIKDTSFYNNSATGISSGYNGGGAIAMAYNYAKIGIIAETKDVIFSNNTSATVGGAIASGMITAGGTININATGGDVKFSNNSAGSNGGAIYNTGTLNINASGGDVIFNNNTAGAYGGAIYNSGTLNISASNGHKVIFENNGVNSSSDIYGGTIYNNGTITSIGSSSSSVLFNNNYATTIKGNSVINIWGGVLLNQSTIGDIYADFTNNTLDGRVWGSVMNYAPTADKTVKITSINGDFINNTSINDGYTRGSAINNYGKKGNVIIESISGNFVGNNSVGGEGATIWNYAADTGTACRFYKQLY